MKKITIYALCLLVVAGGFSACKDKKVKSVSEETKETIVYEDGTVEEKTYKLTPPSAENAQLQDEQETPEPEEKETPNLSEFRAKRILKKQLEKENKARLVAPVRIGYYECNDFNERLNLYKLAANKLIKLQCDEIVTPYGSSYWVTVELTWRGWFLKESPSKGDFPEDRINEEEAMAFLFPKLDQDQWGVPSTDTVVPSQIVEALKTFYKSLQEGQSYNQSLLDANIVCAMSLLDTLASYGVNKLELNPFTRNMELTPELVDSLNVLRVPRLQDAYLVTIGENDFLYVINIEGEVLIEDVAYLAPADINSFDQTVCSLAGKLTKAEILQARKDKQMRDEMEAAMKEYMAKMQEELVEKVEDFEMCKTAGALMYVERTDPTLYDLAKKAEKYETVLLLGGVVKVTDIDKIKVEEETEISATAVATYKTYRVNAVGRIYLGLTNGTKEQKNVNYKYTEKDGWVLKTE